MKEQNSNKADDKLLYGKYQQVSNETVDRSLDKIIIAAAHREAAKAKQPVKLFNPQPRIWDKLRFPVAMSAAVMMTLTLTHMMWPVVQHMNGETNSPEISIHSSASNEGHSAKTFSDSADNLTGNKAENRKLIAQTHTNLQNVNTIPSDNFSVTVDKLQTNSSLSLTEKQKDIERWANEIIELAESGNSIKMQKEMEDFIKKHPDFPIMEMLQPYIQ